MAGWALGASIAADQFFGKDANTYTPWQQGAAAFNANPNTSNYWGDTTFSVDDNGTPRHYRDDIRTVNQTMSPAMRALADKMMGMAGRGQQTFTSGGMGSKLGEYMTKTIGARNPSSYERGSYGFGGNGGPAGLPKDPYTPVTDAPPLLVGGYGGEESTNYDLGAYNKLLQSVYESNRG